MDGTEDEEDSLKTTEGIVKEEKYPWDLLRRTVLLLNVFLGISDYCHLLHYSSHPLKCMG